MIFHKNNPGDHCVRNRFQTNQPSLPSWLIAVIDKCIVIIITSLAGT